MIITDPKCKVMVLSTGDTSVDPKVVAALLKQLEYDVDDNWPTPDETTETTKPFWQVMSDKKRRSHR